MNSHLSPARGGLPKLPAWLALLAGCFLPLPVFSQAYDFGDAPDGADCGYPVAPGQPAIIGLFPTLLPNNGARHAVPGQEWLGGPNSAPDVEFDAKVVNLDPYDGAFPPIPFFLTLVSSPPGATVSFYVTVASGAPAVDRYVNMLIDWDRSGDWRNTGAAAPEWAIQNLMVQVSPGSTQLFTVPIQWGLGAQLSPQIFWVRVTLTRDLIVAANPADGWDGSGSFTHGETEDFLFHPNKKHSDTGVPPSDDPVDGFSYNGPKIKCIPKHQRVAHGRLARVRVELENGTVAPGILQWSNLTGGSDWKEFGESWPSNPPNTTSFAGPSPALGTLVANSSVDPRLFNPEVRTYKVKARWPGFTRSTCKATIEIWHSGWFGVFGLFAHFEILRDDIAVTPADPAGSTNLMLGTLDTAITKWKEGDYADVRFRLTSLKNLIGNHVIDPNDKDRLGSLIDDIRTAMPPDGAPRQPVPEIAYPECGDTVRGMLLCEAFTESPDPVLEAVFDVSPDEGDTWIPIHVDTDPSDGWTAEWDTASGLLRDGSHQLRVRMGNTEGQSGESRAMVWIDNSPPVVLSEQPAPGATLIGVEPVRFMTDPDQDALCILSVSQDGEQFHTIGLDSDPEDGHTARIDVGQLAMGPLELRATAFDPVENFSEMSIPGNPALSFPGWKSLNGLMEGDPDFRGWSADDDLSGDGVPLGLEYYFGLDPRAHNSLSGIVHWEPLPPSLVRLRFSPNLPVDGIRCAIQQSTNLLDWGSLWTDPMPVAGGEVIFDTAVIPGQPNLMRLEIWEERP